MHNKIDAIYTRSIVGEKSKGARASKDGCNSGDHPSARRSPAEGWSKDD